MPWNEVMTKWKGGDLRSGGSGKPVRNRKQAIAIMLAEKRKAAAGNSEYAASKPLSGLKKAGTTYESD